MTWQGVCIHHSATKDSGTSSWEAIRRYHKDVNKWKDIGYHFGVEMVNHAPVVRAGRPIYEAGAHAPGLNNTHIGICVVGNYDVQIPREDALNTLAVLISDLAMVHHFDLSTHAIRYHRDVSIKTCPGNLFVSKQALIARVEQFRNREDFYYS
jgi:N-acetylmuramoyl-L-alanine amidase